MRYSDRKIKGLPVPGEIVVRDLAGYIRLFSDGKYKDYLFRGENANYEETVSSALRGEAMYSFIDMKNKFKKEVWHKLSTDERTFFSAFAQHHGIPTNLIDVTKSPLVALYFACESSSVAQEDYNTDRGFVYLFEDNFVDITNILTKFEDDNLLELYAFNKENILVDMYKTFLDFEKKNPQYFYKYIKKLNDDYHFFFGRGLDKNPVPKRLVPYNNGDYKNEVWKYVINIISEDEKVRDLITLISNKYNSCSFEVLLYTVYLQLFLLKVISYTEPVWWFNIMPNFKYAPILSFERGRNQQGLFIYQTYLQYIETVYNEEVLAQQRVWPSKIIVIENKHQIYKELDFIGINKKFIFGDFDNIASYIKGH